MSLAFTCFTPAKAEPKLFRAEYKATYNGLPVRAKGVRELSKLDNGQYLLVSKATAFFASVTEQTVFSLGPDNRVVPAEYQYRRTGIGRNRTTINTFDWNTTQVRNVKDDAWTMAINADTQDKLSYQQQMQVDLAESWVEDGENPDLVYEVADDGRLKEYRFRVLGKEVTTTPAGEFESIKVTRVQEDRHRVTEFWLAPKHDFLLVRFEQEEEDGSGFKLLLTKFAFKPEE